MPDQSGFVRRNDEDYADAWSRLLPVGQAWPRHPESILARLLLGQSGVWGRIDGRAADLLELETDPRLTNELLPEWERAYGLPDECLAEPLSIAERRRALIERMTLEGGQSRAFFIAAAAALGYSIEIVEYSPFMVGVSRIGDTRPNGLPHEQYRWEIAPPETRFYWTVKVGAVRMTWFRIGWGGGQVGVDPHLRIALATDLECLFRRWKPAHTEIVFNYQNLDSGNVLYEEPRLTWFRTGHGEIGVDTHLRAAKETDPPEVVFGWANDPKAGAP